MADLQIEMDDPARVRRPGDEVTGRVVVCAYERQRCEWLRVGFLWQTRGRGIADRDEVSGVTLFQGEWAPGEVEYPFRLTVPRWPRPYDGELVKLDLEVVAKAKLPWASDPRVAALVPVEPEAIERYPVVLPAPHRSFAAAGVVAAVLFALAGSGLVALAETTDWEPGGGLGIGSFIIGCICFFSSIKRWLAERKIGVVKLWVESAPAGGYRDAAVTEGALRCFVELRETQRIRRMEAELSVTERAEWKKGSNTVVDRSVLYTEVRPLETAGRPGLFTALLPLPRPGSAPFAFRTVHNAVVWKLEARVEIEGWPDWKGDLDLIVLPPGIEPARVVLTVPAQSR